MRKRAQDDRRKDRSERLRIISFTPTSPEKFKVVKDAIQIVGEHKLAGKERFNQRGSRVPNSDPRKSNPGIHTDQEASMLRSSLHDREAETTRRIGLW